MLGLLLLPDLDDIRVIQHIDFDSGRGKKKGEYFSLDRSTKKEKLLEVKKKIQDGKAIRIIHNRIYNHSEILIDIKEFSAVCFTRDPLASRNFLRIECNYHPASDETPLLEALYLRQSYYKASGVSLPIYEYSSIHNIIQKIELTDNDIIQLWSDLIAKHLKNKDFLSFIEKKSLDELKFDAMYGGYITDNRLCIQGNVLHDNYEEDLQQKINNAIEISSRHVLKEFLIGLLSISEKIEKLKLIWSKKSFHFIQQPMELIADILDSIPDKERLNTLLMITSVDNEASFIEIATKEKNKGVLKNIFQLLSPEESFRIIEGNWMNIIKHDNGLGFVLNLLKETHESALVEWLESKSSEKPLELIHYIFKSFSVNECLAAMLLLANKGPDLCFIERAIKENNVQVLKDTFQLLSSEEFLRIIEEKWDDIIKDNRKWRFLLNVLSDVHKLTLVDWLWSKSSKKTLEKIDDILISFSEPIRLLVILSLGEEGSNLFFIQTMITENNAEGLKNTFQLLSPEESLSIIQNKWKNIKNWENLIKDNGDFIFLISVLPDTHQLALFNWLWSTSSRKSLELFYHILNLLSVNTRLNAILLLRDNESLLCFVEEVIKENEAEWLRNIINLLSFEQLLIIVGDNWKEIINHQSRWDFMLSILPDYKKLSLVKWLWSNLTENPLDKIYDIKIYDVLKSLLASNCLTAILSLTKNDSHSCFIGKAINERKDELLKNIFQLLSLEDSIQVIKDNWKDIVKDILGFSFIFSTLSESFRPDVLYWGLSAYPDYFARYPAWDNIHRILMLLPIDKRFPALLKIDTIISKKLGPGSLVKEAIKFDKIEVLKDVLALRSDHDKAIMSGMENLSMDHELNMFHPIEMMHEAFMIGNVSFFKEIINLYPSESKIKVLKQKSYKYKELRPLHYIINHYDFLSATFRSLDNTFLFLKALSEEKLPDGNSLLNKITEKKQLTYKIVRDNFQTPLHLDIFLLLQKAKENMIPFERFYPMNFKIQSIEELQQMIIYDKTDLQELCYGWWQKANKLPSLFIIDDIYPNLGSRFREMLGEESLKFTGNTPQTFYNASGVSAITNSDETVELPSESLSLEAVEHLSSAIPGSSIKNSAPTPLHSKIKLLLDAEKKMLAHDKNLYPISLLFQSIEKLEEKMISVPTEVDLRKLCDDWCEREVASSHYFLCNQLYGDIGLKIKKIIMSDDNQDENVASSAGCRLSDAGSPSPSNLAFSFFSQKISDKDPTVLTPIGVPESTIVYSAPINSAPIISEQLSS